MSRVAVIGHFGIGLNLANGQTIKTKILTDAVEKKINEKAYIVDAHGGVKAIIPVILGCIKALKHFDNVILMLTENGLKVSVPVLSFCNKLFHKKLHYVVIGGWLPKFLKSHSNLEKQLKCFDYIYVETNTMRKALENKGFTNIVVMQNCKELSILSEDELVYQETKPFKICTFSRVMKRKGIEDLVEVVKKINAEKIRYELDIYGQIESQEIEWFENLKSDFTPEIKYCGIVPFDKSVETLKNYYALVFPTKFFTEGVPGTIIDAYAAGIPVIASRWESFNDVVEDGKTGIGYTFDNTDELKNELEKCSLNPTLLNSMKCDCLTRAADFSVDCVLRILVENL